MANQFAADFARTTAMSAIAVNAFFAAARQAFTSTGLREQFEQMFHDSDPERPLDHSVQVKDGYPFSPQTFLSLTIHNPCEVNDWSALSLPSKMSDRLRLDIEPEETAENLPLRSVVTATETDTDDDEELQVVQEISHNDSTLAKEIKDKRLAKKRDEAARNLTLDERQSKCTADASKATADNEELQIVKEIPNSESALAKKVKDKRSTAEKSVPKRTFITDNFVSELINETITEKLDHNVQVVPIQRKSEDRKHVRKFNRHFPYGKVWKKTSSNGDFVDPKLIEKGLLARNGNGRYTYNIFAILEHFGEGTEEIHSILQCLSASHCWKPTQMECNSIAKFGVQFLRAAHGYDRVNKVVGQFCLDLCQTFPSISAERWIILCRSVPA